MIRELPALIGAGSILVAGLFGPGCALLNPPVAEPDPSTVLATVVVRPNHPWTDTGLTVQRGEKLFMTTMGNVRWAASGLTTDADGIDGLVGWRVGAGGLVGRVGDVDTPFAIGRRTTAFPDQHARPPHHPHPAPPIKMPRDGQLFLGFKGFAAGDNQGQFEVTIRRARP
ncbi:MAG: hypothetical protein ABJA98_29385 [Acidobacteriota bacterium]